MSKLDDLQTRLTEFMWAFENVFHDDWSHSEACLLNRGYVASHGTFLNPSVEDESNNWGARGGLLAAYRSLRELMTELGIPSERFAELERQYQLSIGPNLNVG